jgi:hypothetical protein
MRAGAPLATPADLVREACDQLAVLLPRLRQETPELSSEGFVTGTIGRHTVAPVPGNPPAFFAKTGIDASARQLEGVLLYNAGARRPGPLSARGGGDGGTLKALAAIARLIAKADDDLYRMVVSELEQRLGEAQAVRAIDEAQRWRHVRGRACPYCKCLVTIKVLLDRDLQPTGYVECRAAASVRCADRNGRRPSAHISTDDHGRVVLAWADGLVEAAPDMDG